MVPRLKFEDILPLGMKDDTATRRVGEKVIQLRRAGTGRSQRKATPWNIYHCRMLHLVASVLGF
jgi:hypothetical protein